MSFWFLRSRRFWFTVVFAGVLLLPAAYVGWRTVHRLLTNETAQGSVRYEGRGRKGISKYKVVYHVKGQSQVIGEATIGWLGGNYEDREQVKVLYPADDPANGVVANFSNLWLWPLLLALFTIPFVTPVGMWASRGWEEENLGRDTSADALIARDRKSRGRVRKRARRDEDY